MDRREAKQTVAKFSGKSNVIVSQTKISDPFTLYLEDDESVRVEGATYDEAIEKLAETLERRASKKKGR